MGVQVVPMSASWRYAPTSTRAGSVGLVVGESGSEQEGGKEEAAAKRTASVGSEGAREISFCEEEVVTFPSSS